MPSSPFISILYRSARIADMWSMLVTIFLIVPHTCKFESAIQNGFNRFGVHIHHRSQLAHATHWDRVLAYEFQVLVATITCIIQVFFNISFTLCTSSRISPCNSVNCYENTCIIKIKLIFRPCARQVLHRKWLREIINVPIKVYICKLNIFIIQLHSTVNQAV